MRFIPLGISFNIALYGLVSTNVAANAAPQFLPSSQSSSSYLALRQGAATSNQTIIKGNGVQFTVPIGFKGGSPSSAEVRKIATESAKAFPSMAPFVKFLESDPSMVRALAINTNSNGEIALVSRLSIPTNLSLDEIESIMAQKFPEILPPEFKLSEHRVENVGSRQIVKLLVDADVQGLKLQELVGLFREGNEMFQVTYVYSEENSAQAIPVFNQIINSFQATTTNRKHLKASKIVSN
jgi:hypothetical protein